MLEKLKKNYQLSNVLARTLFVLTYVFANWQAGLSSCMVVESLMGISFGASRLWFALLCSVLAGTLWMFLLPPIANVVLNFLKIYSVPRNEYCLLAHAFFALGYFICGLLNLVNLFTPLFSTWGAVLFPFVSSLVAALAFYKVTAKLYFNDISVVYYFKAFATTYLLVVLVLGVLA